MKIFTGNNEIMQKEIEELLKVIGKTKTKSLPIYHTTETLIYFYELLTGRKTGYFRKLTKEDYSTIEKKERILENRKIGNVIATREVHEELVAYLSTYLEEVDIVSKEDEFFENTIPDEKEMYEIIQDFLKSCNQNASFAFDFLIKERRIFQMPKNDELDKAYNLLNLYKNNFYIFVKYSDNIVTTMTDIVHEMGHVMDEMHMRSYNRKKCSYYAGRSLLVEVISTMYEKRFIDFLWKEGIYKKYAELEKETNFSNFSRYLEETELLFYFPNHLLEKKQYQKVPKQDFMNYLKDSFSLTIDQESMFQPKDIDLLSNLEYCYGFVFSTYFLYLKSHDYSRYQESFHNFLKLRADYFPFSFYESIGTTPKELMEIFRDDCDEFLPKRGYNSIKMLEKK